MTNDDRPARTPLADALAAYPPGTDPGRWTTCPRCGVAIPCDTSGRPYSHTCR